VATGIRSSAIERVDCLPADRAFDGIVANQNPRCLAQALRPIVAYYDFIVIDTPPTSDPILVNALVASDQVIVPTLLHHLSFEGVEQFAKSFFWIATGLSRNLRAMLILPNQVDLRVTMQRDVMAKLLRIYGDANVLDGIRVDVAVAEAFGARVPVRLHRPGSKAAEDFAKLALKMREQMNAPVADAGEA
jgi:chromosome partitioning protein